MSPPPVKALSFDAAGTLIELSEPVGESYHRVARNHGIQCDPTDLASAFKIVWQRTPSAFSADSPVRDPDEKSWWRRLVKEVFATSGASLPSDSEFDVFFESLYDHFENPGTWRAIPGAAAALRQISPQFPCVILSNFDGRLRRILADLDLTFAFQEILLSCELGASKPDPKVFEAARRHFRLPPQNILHVGDDPVCDWEGATKASFASFRVGKGQSTLGELLRQLSLA